MLSFFLVKCFITQWSFPFQRTAQTPGSCTMVCHSGRWRSKYITVFMYSRDILLAAAHSSHNDRILSIIRKVTLKFVIRQNCSTDVTRFWVRMIWLQFFFQAQKNGNSQFSSSWTRQNVLNVEEVGTSLFVCETFLHHFSYVVRPRRVSFQTIPFSDKDIHVNTRSRL